MKITPELLISVADDPVFAQTYEQSASVTAAVRKALESRAAEPQSRTTGRTDEPLNESKMTPARRADLGLAPQSTVLRLLPGERAMTPQRRKDLGLSPDSPFTAVSHGEDREYTGALALPRARRNTTRRNARSTALALSADTYRPMSAARRAELLEHAGYHI